MKLVSLSRGDRQPTRGGGSAGEQRRVGVTLLVRVATLLVILQ
jgi:hypothetical protein